MTRLLPAYPLFVKDPYFSIWSPAERLNEKDVIFWTGDTKKLYGYIKVNGKTYCFLGSDNRFEKAEQTDLKISAFTTDYTFKAGRAKLKLSFVSPLPPDDLEMTSCPVCYVKYEISGIKDAEIVFVLDQSICYNGEDFKEVRGGSVRMQGFETAFFGLKRQLPLSDDSDRCGAEWGYWYLSGEKSYYTDTDGAAVYLACGIAPVADRNYNRKVLLSFSCALNGKIMLGFDDTVSIKYFGEYLKGYYLSDKTIFDALQETFDRSNVIDSHLDKLDRDLKTRARSIGEEYTNILYASLRQSVGAHKLVKDGNGELLFLSKECYSNGCIGTVDVSYPSMPLYLLYDPELVRGMLRPIFKFADMPIWKYDFAPHDVGAYPDCCGQVYGLREDDDIRNCDLLDIREKQTRFPLWQLPKSADVYRYESQMPVEESANVLIMLAAAYRADGSTDIVREKFGLLKKWADYLVANGLKPENQLCTDDFSGHLANNLNLAIKATVGIACFSTLCQAIDKTEESSSYRKTAERFAAEITEFFNSFPHSPLTWDSGEDTFGLKYNLAFDKILDLGLFPPELREREVDYYIEKTNEYGIPLDNRADFTKSDWLVWTASLTDDAEKQRKILSGIDKYLRNSEDRLPFGDWYDTKTGRLIGFRNRSVQGACFILLLAHGK
ncbi:MAG: DUF4965 domain-containing protein [Clostridiales bacterium]|nr:DUF4965 domain-containing protein [Clostridiales bacterium]